jgi:hypothetical protein
MLNLWGYVLLENEHDFYRWSDIENNLSENVPEEYPCIPCRIGEEDLYHYKSIKNLETEIKIKQELLELMKDSKKANSHD